MIKVSNKTVIMVIGLMVLFLHSNENAYFAIND